MLRGHRPCFGGKERTSDYLFRGFIFDKCKDLFKTKLKCYFFFDPRIKNKIKLAMTNEVIYKSERDGIGNRLIDRRKENL